MATRLITNDEQLRRYLPNAFATVKGETPFFDRVLPWLQTAERWLFTRFVGDDFADTFLTLDPDEPVRVTAACVVAHAAMRNAVPNLDLVLTPNGFGIVSNQNVAPASRDRVARLIASLEASRDDCTCSASRNGTAPPFADGSPPRCSHLSTSPTSAASPIIGGRTT